MCSIYFKINLAVFNMIVSSQIFLRTVIVCFFIVLFFGIGTSKVWSNTQKEAHARWHINYANYLIDVGKYFEALEYLDTVSDLSSNSKTLMDALSVKASLLALFLDSKEQALQLYQTIEYNFPENAQMAIYRQGILLYEMKNFQMSEKVLRDYIRQFPQGKFYYQAEAILQKIKSRIVPPSYHIMKRPMIRIRLCRNVTEISVSTNTTSQICLNNSYCYDTIKLNVLNNALKVNGKPFHERYILLTSQTPIRVVSGNYKKTVRGTLKISLKNGKLTIINIIDIETYLYSVVPAESYPAWPIETLKSQAIAARTYAMYQVGHRKNREYDMVDNESDQVYGGIEREHSKCTRAVKETTGMVLMQRNRPILAMYSANSGGFTASAKAVFNLSNKNYLIAQKDPQSLKGKMASWTRSFTSAQIASSLGKIGIYCHGITNIRANALGPSGRVIRVTVEDANGSRTLRTRTTLKRALKLPEILFTIKRRKEKYIFDGYGYGHGVGYSQWGGAIMGEKLSAVEILEFYYPGTMIFKYW